MGLKIAQKYELVHVFLLIIKVSVKSLLNDQVVKNTTLGKKIQNNQLSDEMLIDLVLLRI